MKKESGGNYKTILFFHLLQRLVCFEKNYKRYILYVILFYITIFNVSILKYKINALINIDSNKHI